MGEHRGAKWCSEFVSEVYDLAKKVIEESHPRNLLSGKFFPNLIDPLLLEEFAFQCREFIHHRSMRN